MVLRGTIILLLSLSIGLTTQAQHSIRLNNHWEFLRGDLGGIWEAVRPAVKGNPESLPLWKNVQLPHCVNALDAVDPDVNYYQGPSWYKTELEIDNPYPQGRTLLHFEGAGQKTDVYVYTMLVGSHIGGYDEWKVDITDAVAAFKKSEVFQKRFHGKVPISIRCDNSRDLEMIPSNLSDFNVYGGIYRYLNLVYTPALSIDKLFAKASVDKEGRTGKLNIKVRLYNPEKLSTASLKLQLIDPDGKTVLNYKSILHNLNGDIEIDSFILKSPKLWSTDNPLLYRVEASLKSGEQVCTHSENIGFRNFEFLTHGPFLLNGKRLLIRGTQRHEDEAGVGAAMTEEMMRKEMVMIKDMGANFIRLAHYQQSRIILNLCDSLGLLVWEEIPWDRGGLGGKTYQEQAKRMLTNMIEQHYDHPSVIIWSLGNEIDLPGDFETYDQNKVRAFLIQLNNLAHHLDPSRMTAIRRDDFCKDVVDVYSPSIWAGWYRGIYTEYKSVTEQEYKKVNHFLHMEWGGDSHAGRNAENPDKALQNIQDTKSADERAGDASLFGGAARVSKDGDWSESYICNLFDWHLKEQETMPWLTGTAQWIFKDFSTPIRPDNPIPYVNQKGLVQRDMTKKEGYYVFQSYWSKKPMVHIYGHNWPVRWGNKDEEKMVKVYSNCEKAELFLNGKSCGIKRRNSQDFPAAGLRWLIPFATGKNHLSVIARIGNQLVKDSVEFEYQVAKWGKPAIATLQRIAQQNDTTTIEVKLYDNNHTLCLDAANWVRFGLVGDGKLIDDMGTASGSRYIQLYNGRAIIRIKTNGGNSVASAKVEGVPVVFLNL